MTHLDERGRARMVDVGAKAPTRRAALAEGFITLGHEAYDLAKGGGLPKGDLLAVARLAGIQAAKWTPHLIPLCHPVPLDEVTLDFEWDDTSRAVRVVAGSRAEGKTGVEMEALTACAVACLALYDMVKGVDKEAVIGPIALLKKSGGKSGDYRRRGRLSPCPTPKGAPAGKGRR